MWFSKDVFRSLLRFFESDSMSLFFYFLFGLFKLLIIAKGPRSQSEETNRQNNNKAERKTGNRYFNKAGTFKCLTYVLDAWLKISKEHIQNRWGELICVPSPFTAQVWGGEAATDSTEGRHSPRWLNKGCLVIYSNVLQWNICREKAPSLLRRPFVTNSLMYFKNNKWARTSRSHSASNLLMWGEKNETSEC